MSRSTSPFIPPLPGSSPAGNTAPVIPHTPGAPPNPYPYPPPGAPWGYAYPQPPGRSRRNSRVDGMPPGMPPGVQPFDPATYFSYPANPAGYVPGATPAMPRGLGLMADDPWHTSYLSPDYGQGPPVIPPRPSGSRSRSHSRGPSGGFSSDWVGPQTPGEHFPMATPGPVPAAYAGYVPPGTPWYLAPGMTPGTSYSRFDQALPYPYYGAPPPRNYAHPRSAYTTPYRGHGYLPPSPGEEQYNPLEVDRPARPEQASGMVDTRWFTGSNYGPVLDPLLAGIANCSFRINPLIGPPPDDPAKRAYLNWNMLFSTSYVHRSDERSNQSWIKGRNAPATHPRLSRLRIISRQFTWFVEVRAQSEKVGVTCGDVVEALSKFLSVKTDKKDYDSLPAAKKASVTEAYYYNRSRADDVPGGRLGDGMRRVDFLGPLTMWGGVEVDQRYVAERMSLDGRGARAGMKREMVGVFVVNCETRLPMTDEERRAEAARGSDGDDDGE